MAKQVVIYHMNNDQEIKSALTSNSVSYKQLQQNRENTVLHPGTHEPNLDNIKIIMEGTQEDVAIVFMRSYIEPDTMLIGTAAGMIKRAVASLIDILEETEGIVKV